MASLHKVTPCLWFDSEAEAAARFYVSIFDGSEIEGISHFGKAGFEFHGRPEGSVLTVAFKLQGQPFTALNGGPHHKFTPAISLQVFCDTQQEIDEYWEKLCEGGEPGRCGWLIDKFGLSWQITPACVPEMMRDPDPAKVERVFQAVLPMRKVDLSAVQRAYAGE